MKNCQLGKSNLEASALELGCMRMSFGDRPVGSRQEMIALIHTAVEKDSLGRINLCRIGLGK